MKMPKRLSRSGVLVALGVLALICILWGAARSLAFGEQQPARALLVFGGLALVISVSIWAAERRERP
jgi:uncharacterized membrane protein